MISSRVNPNISYASVASKNLNLKNVLPQFPAKNYTFLSPYQQRFPLPYDVMKYILQNPKPPNQLQKLYQTCKYFYSKKQVLIVAGEFRHNDPINLNYHFKNNYDLFKNVKTPFLWFSEDLMIDKFFNFNFTKFYRSTIKALTIHGEIAFKDFQMLVAEKTVENFIFSYFSRIYNYNNEEVSIDQILQLLPNVKKFWYFRDKETYSKEILQKMNVIKTMKMQQFYIKLFELSDDFDANLLFEFIQKNVDSMCKINLIPWGENYDTILLQLKTAEKKFKFKKEWEDKKFDISFVSLL